MYCHVGSSRFFLINECLSELAIHCSSCFRSEAVAVTDSFNLMDELEVVVGDVPFDAADISEVLPGADLTLQMSGGTKKEEKRKKKK